MKTYLPSPLAAACAGALLLAGVAFAQNAPMPPDNTYPDNPSAPSAKSNDSKWHDKNDGAMKVSRADQRFFNKASRLGEKEVALSRIAAERATNPQVRAFASEMVSAHTAANSELAALVRQKGARLDDRDQAIEQRELAKKWNDKKAAGFDEDYLEAMIDAHEDTVDVLENGAKSKDTEIASYSGKLLPTVKAHLAEAEKLKDLVD